MKKLLAFAVLSLSAVSNAVLADILPGGGDTGGAVPVPESGSLMLLVAGLLVVVGLLRKK